jgi:L-ascorbate metabolism protein UlaG (beta-lactamase superfamily)
MTDQRGRLAWLGHATVMIELDGVRLLTDPLLRRRTLHLHRIVPLPDEPLGGVDAVLISHAHWDHFDLASIRRLGRDVRVVVPRGVGILLARKRFANVTEVDEGDEVRVGDVVVRATYAEHRADRGPLGIRTPSLGYVVAGDRSVYFAGDTDLFDGMRSLATGLDVALLPVAGWGSKLPPGHMGPDAAAEAAARLQPHLAIPIHWATLAPFHRKTVHDPDAGEAFARKVHEKAPAVEVRVLRVGEACAI